MHSLKEREETRQETRQDKMKRGERCSLMCDDVMDGYKERREERAAFLASLTRHEEIWCVVPSSLRHPACSLLQCIVRLTRERERLESLSSRFSVLLTSFPPLSP
jgi:hypothetical protein